MQLHLNIASSTWYGNDGYPCLVILTILIPKIFYIYQTDPLIIAYLI